MKILGRTMVILAAALLVVGATFAVSRSGLAAGMSSGGPRRERFEQGQAPQAAGATGADSAGNAQGVAPAQFERGGPPEGFERGRGGGLFGLLEVLQSAVIIGLIVAAVVLPQRLWRRLRPAQYDRRPQSPTDSGEYVEDLIRDEYIR